MFLSIITLTTIFIFITDKGDANCTGSIDPAHGGGYTAFNGTSQPGVLQDFDKSLDDGNYVSSSWCDYGLACNKEHVCQAGRH